MKNIILLLTMIFCHIVDDFYLQIGFLSSAKQRKWWAENAPNPLYKNDYKMALIVHAFSWSFMIHIPLVINMIISKNYISTPVFIVYFLLNMVFHAYVDDLKANKLKISLVKDQLFHICQIFITWITYIIV